MDFVSLNSLNILQNGKIAIYFDCGQGVANWVSCDVVRLYSGALYSAANCPSLDLVSTCRKRCCLDSAKTKSKSGA